MSVDNVGVVAGISSNYPGGGTLGQGGGFKGQLGEARPGPWVGTVGGEGGMLLRTHFSVRILMGYRTGMLVVAELSSRRPESSLSLHWGKGRAVSGAGLGQSCMAV